MEPDSTKRARAEEMEMDEADVRSIIAPLVARYTQERPLHRVNMVVLSDACVFFVPREGEWYRVEAGSVPGVGSDHARVRALFGAIRQFIVDQNLPFFEFNGSVLARMDFDARERLFVSRLDGSFVSVAVYDFPALQAEFETVADAQSYHAKNQEFCERVWREMETRRAQIEEMNRLFEDDEL